MFRNGKMNKDAQKENKVSRMKWGNELRRKMQNVGAVGRGRG